MSPSSRGLWPVWEVARWEFRRYVKPKQQVVALVITLLFMLGGTMLTRLSREPSTIELAVVGVERLDLPSEFGRFRIEAHDDASLAHLRREVEERDRDALLVLAGDGRGELFTRQAPGWRAELERELGTFAMGRRLEASGLEMARLAAIQEPFALEVHEAAPRAGRGERVAAFVALGLTLIGLFGGVGYIFASVTGEKQNRLSEQVISAIPPQAWIDGKILGLAGVSLVGVLNLVVSGALFLVVARLIWERPIPLPTTVERIDLLVLALLAISIGFLFWFAFLAAVAAVVDDPHTSTRNQLLFLPMLPMVPAFVAVGDPGAIWIRVLSVVPPTSSAVLPVRLLVTEVPWWEIAVTLALLLGATLFIRRMAGRVFRLGMLMYGKEPSWREIRRWLRESRPSAGGRAA